MIPINLNTKPINILLVEDDDGDAKAVLRGFQKKKIHSKIIRAVDGEEALDILKGRNGKENISPPYILLVDLNMPKMNGIELIKRVRNDPEICQAIVFIFTTSNRDEDKAACYDLNVAGYIVKSTEEEDFLNLVNMIGSYQE